MRRILLAALFLFLASCGGEPEHRVLFIGNSYTHYNDMPNMVEKISSTNGVKIETTMIAPGGAYWHEHVENREVIDAIQSGEFDTVVFQEQSVAPSVPSFAATNTFPAARRLDTMADAAGLNVIWYQTWGRQNGFPDVGYSEYTPMQEALIASYEEIAEINGGTIARVGEKWQRAGSSLLPFTLYTADGSHPSPQGSYLAALEIADAIIIPPIIEAPSVNGVDEETAQLLLDV